MRVMAPSSLYPWSAGDLLKLRPSSRVGSSGRAWRPALLLERPRAPRFGNYPYTFTLLLDGRVCKMSETEMGEFRRLLGKRESRG